MDVKSLKARLREMGVKDSQIDDLDETDDIKAAAITLINEVASSGNAAAADVASPVKPAPEYDALVEFYKTEVKLSEAAANLCATQLSVSVEDVEGWADHAPLRARW